MPCYRRESTPSPRTGPAPRPSLRSAEERNRLAEANLSLVHGVLRRLRLTTHPHFDDLAQGGMLGLLRACELWEPEKGALSTFADFQIRRGIQTAMSQRHMIRLPNDPRGGTFEELSAKLLMAHLPDDYDDLGDPHADDPSDFDDETPTDRIEALLGLISHAKHREAVRLRFVEGLILDRIAERLGGVTRERARQCVNRGLATIRERLGVAGE